MTTVLSQDESNWRFAQCFGDKVRGIPSRACMILGCVYVEVALRWGEVGREKIMHVGCAIADQPYPLAMFFFLYREK